MTLCCWEQFKVIQSLSYCDLGLVPGKWAELKSPKKPEMLFLTGIPDPRRMRRLVMAWKGCYRPGPPKYSTAVCGLSLCLCSFALFLLHPGLGLFRWVNSGILYFMCSDLAQAQSPVRTPQHWAPGLPSLQWVGGCSSYTGGAVILVDGHYWLPWIT
jgi:hypothetical protein